MTTFEEVIKVLEELDVLQRKGEESAKLQEQFFILLMQLTNEEQAIVENRSVELFAKWTPMERFNEAERMLKLNLPPATMEYWKNKRDEAAKEMK